MIVLDKRLLVAVIVGLVIVASVAYYLTLPEEEEKEPGETEPMEEEELGEEGTYTVELICDVTTMEIGKEYSATIVFNSTRYEGEVWLAPVSIWGGPEVDKLYLDFQTPAFRKHNISSGECAAFPVTLSWSGKIVNDTSVFINIRSQQDLQVRTSLQVTVLGLGQPKAFILFLENVDLEKENHVGWSVFDSEGGYILEDMRYRYVTSLNKTFEVDEWGLQIGCGFEVWLVEHQCDLVVRLVNPKREEVLNTVIGETGQVVSYKITPEDLEGA